MAQRIYRTARNDRLRGVPDEEIAARRSRAEDREVRRKKRMRELECGFIQAARRDRLFVRQRRDWLLYALYEHIFDLAKFRGYYRGRALVYLWELADDLGVTAATITRKIAILEELRLIFVRRTKSDCFPTMIFVNTHDNHRNSRQTSHPCAQNAVTPISDAVTPDANVVREPIDSESGCNVRAAAVSGVKAATDRESTGRRGSNNV